MIPMWHPLMKMFAELETPGLQDFDLKKQFMFSIIVEIS
jgi:hypothetical protein